MKNKARSRNKDQILCKPKHTHRVNALSHDNKKGNKQSCYEYYFFL